MGELLKLDDFVHVNVRDCACGKTPALRLFNCVADDGPVILYRLYCKGCFTKYGYMTGFWLTLEEAEDDWNENYGFSD